MDDPEQGAASFPSWQSNTALMSWGLIDEKERLIHQDSAVKNEKFFVFLQIGGLNPRDLNDWLMGIRNRSRSPEGA
jgi:hypothetical protein